MTTAAVTRIRAATVLVPLDRSHVARATVPVASELARVLGAGLHVLHVSDSPMHPRTLPDALGLSPADRPGALIDAAVGDPEREILGAATRRDSELIVMGMRGLGSDVSQAAPTHGLGHVALNVLRRARCPVVLVPPRRGDAPFRLGRIMLPEDGTPGTAAAFREAAKLSRRANALLHVLRVAAVGPPEAGGTLATPTYVDQPQHEWPAWIGEMMGRLECGCTEHPADVELGLQEGEPSSEILRAVVQHGIDLVVLPFRGVLEPARARTLQAILRGTPCPVMLVRNA
jgi:nucleotide-binding universal stress UspA family protein